MKNALFYMILTTQNALFYKFRDIRMPYFTYFKVFRMPYFTSFREVHTHYTNMKSSLSAKENSVYFATKPFFYRP